MLIKLKANIPEIFLGVFLSIAIFAMGMTFESSRTSLADKPQRSADQRSGPPAPENSADKTTDWLLVGLNFLLVISTLMLWKANNRSAKIAERALTELEAPFVTVEILASGLTFTLTGGVTSPISDFRYQFVNHGRTTAQLTELVGRNLANHRPGQK